MNVARRTVTIEVPDVELMSDSELESLARHRDGRWSSLTKLLLEKFATTKLDLNSGWAWTMQFWQCPCCHRSKTEIARKSSGGILLCRLEVHHDHLTDRAKKIINEFCPRPAELSAVIQIFRAKDLIVPLVERFERALICLDCNTAEGLAKSELRKEVDRHFSFSPSEIASFIESGSNRPHKVDIAAAHKAWTLAKFDFEDRINFVRRMAQRLANGKHRRELSGATGGIGPMDDRNFIFQQFIERLPRHPQFALGAEVDARSTSNDSAGESLKPKKKPTAKPPTDEEFANIDLANRESKTWQLAGEDWKCPCCHRTKKEICRKSNSGKWTASIHRYREFQIETDANNLQRRSEFSQSEIVIRAEAQALICQDCRHVVAEATRRKPSLDAYHLPIDDIRDLISVSANALHVVDYDQVIERVLSIRSLAEAIDDYENHRSDALGMQIEFKLLTEKTNSKRAYEMLTYEYAKSRDVDLEDAVSHVRWLLQEAARFENELKQ